MDVTYPWEQILLLESSTSPHQFRVLDLKDCGRTACPANDEGLEL